jgi:membrane-associated phospholipid phosphatase
MKRFFSTLPRHFLACFSGRMILWHLAAILLTLILVVSGFDWGYFRATRAPSLILWMFPAVVIGGLLPILLPLGLLASSGATDNAVTRRLAWAIGQAEIIGAIIAALYKALTGRAHPARSAGADLTHFFRFGLVRGGVFWGWPSSHTTIAFAMAVTIFMLLPKPKAIGYAAIAYAFYVGLGVSMTIHWFSDFTAGAIFGSIVGVVVGRGFATQPAGTPPDLR